MCGVVNEIQPLPKKKGEYYVPCFMIYFPSEKKGVQKTFDSCQSRHVASLTASAAVGKVQPRHADLCIGKVQG